ENSRSDAASGAAANSERKGRDEDPALSFCVLLFWILMRSGRLRRKLSKEKLKVANDNQKRTGLSRRNFIKSAATAAGATVLGGAATATAAEVTVLGNAPGPMGKGPSLCDDSQDLALINGKFLTLDDKNSIVSAVAIRNGRIAEVGRHAQAIGPCAQTINLRGATVIPG